MCVRAPLYLVLLAHMGGWGYMWLNSLPQLQPFGPIDPFPYGVVVAFLNHREKVECAVLPLASLASLL
jgi:hypothetical protein